jgi:hypothetical protein
MKQKKNMVWWFWCWQVLLIVVLVAVGVCCLFEECLKYRDRRVAQIKAEQEEEHQDVTSRILFTRHFTGSTASGANEVTDALLDYISNIDTVSCLKYSSFYIMDTEEEFTVHKDKCITGQVQKIVLEESTGTIKLLSFYLQSYCLSITELREWVSDVHSEYTVNKNNELGSKRYFFNQLPEKQQRGDKKLNLSFDMSPFETTKTLDNLYGEHIDKVQSRIELFQNKSWYQRNGVPHTLGILLYGEPGCGKTSLIKAIANDTNRHVFNVRLSDTMTKDQLSHLFFDPKVYVRNKETNTFSVITIPLNQRLYVLEDIDCAENTVLSRALLNSNDLPVTAVPNVPQFAQGMFGERELDMIKEQVNKEKEERIDLAFLLNILDGVLETPQRLIIMTTNYPSKLDAALLRPGRIDLMLEFKRCNVEMLLTMVQNFYEDEVETSPLLDEQLNEVLTPAEVQEVLCNYIDDAEGAVQQIKTLATRSRRRNVEHTLEPYKSTLLLPKISTCASNVVTPAPCAITPAAGVTCLSSCLPANTQVGVEECKSNTKNPLATLPVLRPMTGSFDTVPGLKPINEVYSTNVRPNPLETSRDTSTNFLPAPDVVPEPRRESQWLKYQM